MRFDANVTGGLPWRFEPEQNAIEVKLGEVVTVNYVVTNLAARDDRRAGRLQRRARHDRRAYFQKINCFCFTEQRLEPGEKREMAVVFYVDPALAKDWEQDDLNTITLSYSFYAVREPAPAGSGSRDEIGDKLDLGRARAGDERRETTMADAHAKPHHDYHLVDPSPWPIVGSVAALLLAVGLISVDAQALSPRRRLCSRRARSACSTR